MTLTNKRDDRRMKIGDRVWIRHRAKKATIVAFNTNGGVQVRPDGWRQNYSFATSDLELLVNDLNFTAKLAALGADEEGT